VVFSDLPFSRETSELKEQWVREWKDNVDEVRHEEIYLAATQWHSKNEVS
jgi:hypothetical protein